MAQKVKTAERDFIRFTRSSIIVYAKCAKRLGWKEGTRYCDVTLHDVNGTGTLYGMNFTGRTEDLFL